MPSRIDPIRPGESGDSEVNTLIKEAESGWHEDSAFFGAMAHQPSLFKKLVSTLREFPQNDSITIELLELMRLRIAYLHQCTYCTTVRTKEVQEDIAQKESAIFNEDIDGSKLTRREELALRLIDDLCKDPHKITDAYFEKLQEEFNDEEIVELLLFASIEIGLDRFTIALNLNTTDKSPYPTDLEYPLAEISPKDE